MTPRSVPSRRRFLAGASGVGAALVAGCSSLNGVLPDRVVRSRTRRRSIPEVPPAVETTEDHLETAAAEIDDYAADGLEAWERLDEPAERRAKHQHRIHGSGLERAAEFAEELPSEPPVVETVEAAGYHLTKAAGGYAYARARVGAFDRDPSEEAATWLEEIESVAERFAYETGDPETFLAYGRQIEYSLDQAGNGLSWRADDEVEDWDQPDDADELADSYGFVQRSRLRVLEASAYRDALRERDDGGDSIAETIAEGRTVLRERVDDLRSDREQWLDRLGAFEGERGTVHDALYSRSSHNGAGTDRYVERGFEVYGAVELAETWLLFETARAERDRLEEADEAELDSASIDAAKRDAVDRLEDALTASPAPLTRYFLAEARGWISAGDSGLERRSRDDDEDWEWSRANAFARYLLGKGMVERTPRVVGLLAGDERDLE